MSACTDLVVLDPYLDGVLAPDEVRAYERHVAGCAVCAEELRLAEQVSAALGASAETCPPEVLHGALARIAADEWPARIAGDERPARIAGDRPPRTMVRRTFRLTVLALAASAILAALAVSPLLRERSAVEEAAEPTPVEVARARADVERALGLVGEATRDAGIFLRDDVLAPHVAEPAAVSILEALGLSD